MITLQTITLDCGEVHINMVDTNEEWLANKSIIQGVFDMVDKVMKPTIVMMNSPNQAFPRIFPIIV